LKLGHYSLKSKYQEIPLINRQNKSHAGLAAPLAIAQITQLVTGKCLPILPFSAIDMTFFALPAAGR
jgi:hypothetical protein